MSKTVTNNFSHKNFILSFRFRITIILLTAFIYGAGDAAFLYLYNFTLERLDLNSEWAVIYMPLGLMVSVWVFQNLLKTLADLMRVKIESRYAHKSVLNLFSHLTKVEQKVLDNSSSGELSGRVIEDSKIAFENFFRPISEIFVSASTLLTVTISLFILNWKTTLILLFMAIIIGVISAWSISRLRKLSEDARNYSSNVWSGFYEALRNMKFIRANNLEQRYSKDTSEKLDFYYKKRLKIKRFQIGLVYFEQLTFAFAWVGIFVVSIYFHIQSPTDMPIAKISSFAIATINIRWPLVNIVDQLANYKESAVSFERLNQVMRLNQVTLESKTQQFNDGSIEFDKVNFSYDGKRKIIQQASFKLNSGKTYAIIGKTGSGKSTIFDLIVGVYPIDAGKIFVGGVELNRASTKAIRDMVTFCYQMPFLINDTIEKNLLLLNPDVDRKRFDKVLEVTGCKPIINRLTNGLSTVIGDAGTQLSGGERKRIQLAQSLMRNTEIYMFDELTASLDQNTAQEIMRGIQEFLIDKTLLFIEHRLNMIEGIEEIWEFKNHTLLKVDADFVKKHNIEKTKKLGGKHVAK